VNVGGRAGNPVTCPRCGLRSVLTGGPFCPNCGRYLAPLHWVAEPPPSAAPPPAPPHRLPYAGPPRYRFLPRWGFPPRAWVPPEPPGPPPPDPLHAARSILGTLVPLLWAVATVSVLAAGAEAWRYVLLLISRDSALSPGVVATSDALVTVAGTVAPVLAALAGIIVVLWTLRAARAAADRAHVEPARSDRAIVVGWVVPGLNLVLPGSVLAEIEHTALGRPPGQRPRPSRMLVVWWVLWGAGVVLAGIVLLWSLRTGVQARADGVVLHAVLDVLAAATAATTALLLTYLTRLLAPARTTRRELVVAVS
jgi:Domain of unknown function (DUF4328)